MITILQIVVDQPYIALGVTVVGLFTTVAIYVNSSINKRFSKKADKEATEREFNLMHDKINEKVNFNTIIIRFYFLFFTMG